MSDTLDWKRYGDRESGYWLEMAKVEGVAHLRAPTAVIERMYRMATKPGYTPRYHFISTTEEEGKVTHIAGKPCDLAEFIETTKKRGPGPLARMWIE